MRIMVRMSNKKNVAIIIGSISGGGAERVAGNLSIFLSEYYNVFLFVDKPFDITYDYKGALVHIRNTDEYSRLTLSEILRIKKKQYNIDIAISFMEWSNFANICSRGKERVIISERTTITSFYPRKKYTEGLIKKLYKYADCIVACSNGVGQALVEDIGISEGNIKVIYNLIEKNNIYELAEKDIDKELHIFLDGFDYFVNVGRLINDKRQYYLIDQFYEFHKKYMNRCKLVIIGDGPEYLKLSSHIKELELEDFVMIYPFTTNPFCICRNAKAFISTSNREGFPNAILEAFVMGTPVIAADCMSGPREILDGNNDYTKIITYPKVGRYGILIDNDLVNNELANAMKWIIDNPDLYSKMKDAELEYIERYSNDEITSKWISIIENDECGRTEVLSIDEDALNIKQKLRRFREIYIYGTGIVGKRVYHTFASQYPIKQFIVTDTNKLLGQYLFDLPIRTLKEVDVTGDDIGIIIGVGEALYDEVYENLLMAGAKNILSVF